MRREVFEVDYPMKHPGVEGWWARDFDDDGEWVRTMGPYATREEAEKDDPGYTRIVGPVEGAIEVGGEA